MKRKQLIILSVIIICGCLILWFYSSKKNDYKLATLYKLGRNWQYRATVHDSLGNSIDTFTLLMNSDKPKSIVDRINGSILINYTYKRGATQFEQEKSSATDNQEYISVNTPEYYTLDFTQILPSLSVSKKVNKHSWREESSDGFFIPSSSASYFDKIKKKNVSIAGKKIERYSNIADTTTIDVLGKQLFCYVLEVKNKNLLDDIGQFRGRYLFNEQYGIVKWIFYTPWNETTTLDLKSVNF